MIRLLKSIYFSPKNLNLKLLWRALHVNYIVYSKKGLFYNEFPGYYGNQLRCHGKLIELYRVYRQQLYETFTKAQSLNIKFAKTVQGQKF